MLKKGIVDMGKIYTNRLLTSIDVGTTKICVLIAQQLDENHIEILGIGKVPSDGLRKGVVVDIAKTIHSIRLAIQEAQLMAGVKIESAAIGISGAHITSCNSHGVVPIKRGNITQQDIDSALAAAQAISIERGQQILHVLPQYFIIDGTEKVHDPLGMHGVRLEVQAHIILGAIASVQNLVKCCESAGIKVDDIILEQLASAYAVLSYDERKLGVGVLDIGGGTSDLAIYQDGSIRHTKVIPIAGNHFTHDLAIGLRTTIDDAERIKVHHGLTLIPCVEKIDHDGELYQDTDPLLEIAMIGGNGKKLIRRSELIDIIQPRAQELLHLAHEEIIKEHLQQYITTGMVLTGGGSLLRGMRELAEPIFGVPVRIGNPHITFDIPESLQSPIFATGYGILLHGVQKRNKNTLGVLNGPFAVKVFERMKSWVLDFF
jgi:cell division protein FtsA